MDFLNAHHPAALLRVTQSDVNGKTLLDHVSPYLKLTPLLILDLGGMILTSMNLGDLVNVVDAYKQQWGGQFNGLMLVRVSDQVRRTLSTTHLENLLRPFATADAALEALDRGR